MKVLLVDQSAANLLLVAGCLRDLGHEVRTASSRKDAMALLGQGLPQLVVVDSVHPDSGGLEVVRLVRGLEAPHYIYVLMLTADVPEDRLLPGYEAGIDNHARVPVTREQLAGRLRAAERVAGAARRPGDRAAHAASEAAGAAAHAASDAADAAYALAPPAHVHGRVTLGRATAARPAAGAEPDAAMAPPIDAVAAVTTWRDAPANLCAVTGEFFPVPIELASAAASDGALTFAWCISLANVQQQIEQRVLIAGTDASVRAMAMHLLGEDTPALANHMLSELAKTLMGSLKSGFAREQVAFTGDPPRPTELDRFDRWQARCEYQQGFVLRAEGAELIVRLGMRTKMTIVVPVSRLREHMIIAKDILHVNGSLLVPSGTRLSATTALRLRRLVPNASVELMDPGDVLDYLTERSSAR
jgi:CheY-like chemotaxis protein